MLGHPVGIVKICYNCCALWTESFLLLLLSIVAHPYLPPCSTRFIQHVKKETSSCNQNNRIVLLYYHEWNIFVVTYFFSISIHMLENFCPTSTTYWCMFLATKKKCWQKLCKKIYTWMCQMGVVSLVVGVIYGFLVSWKITPCKQDILCMFLVRPVQNCADLVKLG